MAAACNMLWIGPALGPLERACIASVLRQGHRLVLWCYQRPEGLPPGAVAEDAAQILPETAVVRHRSGSPSLFSNRFRYELQRRSKGIWLDSDVYLLRPLPDADLLLGWQDAQTINGAVLRLPPDSPLLPPLLALFEDRAVPPWLSLPARFAARWQLLRTGRAGLERMPWGVAGPQALTALARRHGLAGRAMPRSVFYPVHWTEAAWIVDPGERLEDRVADDTVAVHLWNERIRHLKDRSPPPGSFLARLHEEAAGSG